MTKNKNGVKKTSGVLLIWVAAQGLPGSPRAGIMRYSLDRLAQSPNPHRFTAIVTPKDPAPSIVSLPCVARSYPNSSKP